MSLSELPSLPNPLAVGNTRRTRIYKEASNVLKHMIYDQELFENSRDHIEEMQYFAPYPHFSALHDMMKVYYADTGKTPNHTTYDVELEEHLEANSIHPAQIAECVQLVSQGLNLHPVHANMEDVHLVLKEEYAAYVQETTENRISQGGFDTPDDLLQYMRSQTLKLEVDPYTSAKAVGFFDMESDKALDSMQREPIGVSFMDEMLEGGPAPGELIGILAPSGGGKSTFSCMAAASVIGMHKHCYYISTEQKLAGDLSSRFYTLITNNHRNVFSQGWKGVPESVKLMFEERKKELNQYSHFLDATDTQYKSLEALFSPIRKSRASGEVVPSLIIVDWWGRLSDQIALNNPHLKDSADKRQFKRNLLHSMKQYAEELHCPIVVLHQLTGQANKKGSKAKISSADAQEDATFNNMFDFCFVFGNRNSDDVFDISTDKARGQARTSKQQKLDGAYCRIVDATSDYDAQEQDLTASAISALPGILNGQSLSDFTGAP